MIWIALMFILAIGAAMGMILSSSLRAYTDPHHAAFLLGAASRTRPPGALLRLRKDAPLDRYAATGAMRGVQLRKARTKIKNTGIVPSFAPKLTPVSSQLTNTEAASCGCGGA